MPNSERGGLPEQHAKAGEQSHKNTSGSGSKESGSEGSARRGSSEQHSKAGEQSHKNTSGSGSKEAMSRSEWLRPRRNALYLRNRLKNEKSFVSPDDRSAGADEMPQPENVAISTSLCASNTLNITSGLPP
jgi:hypothetical protein